MKYDYRLGVPWLRWHQSVSRPSSQHPASLTCEARNCTIACSCNDGNAFALRVATATVHTDGSLSHEVAVPLLPSLLFRRLQVIAAPSLMRAALTHVDTSRPGVFLGQFGCVVLQHTNASHTVEVRCTGTPGAGYGTSAQPAPNDAASSAVMLVKGSPAATTDTAAMQVPEG